MAIKRLVNFSFTNEKIKLYRISEEGLQEISQLINYLTIQLTEQS
jgi:hypothetical protein